MRLTSAEVHTLTGPYVLNALPEDERIGFESHLSDCDSCTAEVAELREAAHKLGTAVAVEPPPALKARVMAATATTRQLPPLVPAEDSVQLRSGQQRKSFSRRSFFSLAAATAAVLGAGGVAFDQYRDNSRTKEQNAQLAVLLAQSDVKTVSRNVAGGGQATVVVSARKNQAVVLLRGLPKLPDDKTYQLWLLDRAQTPFSVGLADGQTDDDQTKVIRGGVADKAIFGLTVERKGGADKPTLPAAALFKIA